MRGAQTPQVTRDGSVRQVRDQAVSGRPDGQEGDPSGRLHAAADHAEIPFPEIFQIDEADGLVGRNAVLQRDQRAVTVDHQGVGVFSEIPGAAAKTHHPDRNGELDPLGPPTPGTSLDSPGGNALVGLHGGLIARSGTKSNPHQISNTDGLSKSGGAA